MIRYIFPLFFFATVYPQSLDGFIDFKWKSIKPQIKYGMSKQEGAQLTTDDDDLLAFRGGEFANKTVRFWSFWFYDDKFYHVDVVFDTLLSNSTEIFHSAKSYLEDIYGRTDLFQRIDQNKRAIFWTFYGENNEPESLVQLIRTTREGKQDDIQISYTYLPLYMKKKGIK
jgi:hypothetical protein